MSNLKKWPIFLLSVLLAGGLYVASYLAYAHVKIFYDPSWESDCNFSATFNCDVVNTSEYSELLGLPIALYAVPVYAVLLWLSLGALLRRRGEDARAQLGLIALAGAGALLYSLFLAAVSAFVSAVAAGRVTAASAHDFTTDAGTRATAQMMTSVRRLPRYRS